MALRADGRGLGARERDVPSVARPEPEWEPTRISFVEALRLIRDEWAWFSVTSPGAIPKRLASVRASVKR